MLKGIDISEWQDGIALPYVIKENRLDFVVARCGYGLYTDTCCDNFIQDCIKTDTLWGFYHFATAQATATEQANYVYKTCKNYFHHGIHVLDMECDNIYDWGAFAQEYVDRIHVLTGVYPLIYMSSQAYLRERFAKTMIPKTCGLWEAFYLTTTATDFDSIPDYEGGTSPWDFGAMWQFSSYGNLKGWHGNLDLDVAWMNKDGWLAYAGYEGKDMNNTQELPIAGNLHTFEDDSVRVTVEVK